jgi:small subunit ribosomal protein S18
MAKAKTRRTQSRVYQRSIREKATPEKINFEISYKNYEGLARFMNDRAKILGRKRTGIAARDQRKLTREIKRARILGLLPFSSRV